MKQILVVGAGHHFPKGPFSFLNSMKEQEPIHAKGLFFRPVDYTALAARTGASMVPVLDLEDNEKEMLAVHKELFARQCEQQHIPYSLHENNGEWDKDLLQKESRFADLILISGELFYAETNDRQPNLYLREALHSAECPVLLVPENFTSIQHLFMAYDGSRDSLYALKQFCYLFPNLIDLPTEILYVKEGSGNIIPDLDNLKQFTRAKFDCMNFSRLHFNASEYLATWISEKKYALLVSGSYGRSPVSYIGNRSFSDEIIREHQLPIFVAHR